MNNNTNNNTNNREIETEILRKIHGNDTESNEKITKLLSERYSNSGSQKPFLALEATSLREDKREELKEKIKKKRKFENEKKNILSKTLKKRNIGNNVGSDNNNDNNNNNLDIFINRKGRAKIRHTRLNHARNGLYEYIDRCKKSQEKLEVKLKTLQHRRRAQLNKQKKKQKQKQNNDDKLEKKDDDDDDYDDIENHLDPKVLQYKYGIPTIEQFITLNELWNGYINELLFNGINNNNTNNNNNLSTTTTTTIAKEMTLQHKLILASKLASADFHGAWIKVISALNPSMVGTEGIIIWEAKTNFVMVVDGCFKKQQQKEDESEEDNNKFGKHKLNSFRDKIGGLRIIEKRGSIFSLKVNNNNNNISDTSDDDNNNNILWFDIIGSRILYRTTDRSGKKFKPKSVFDLV